MSIQRVRGTLRVNVVGAKINADAVPARAGKPATCNAYAVIHHGKQKAKGSTIEGNYTPTWRHNTGFETDSVMSHDLLISLWSYRRWGVDDFIGFVQIPMAKYADGQRHDEWFPMGSQGEWDRVKPSSGLLDLIAQEFDKDHSATATSEGGKEGKSTRKSTGSKPATYEDLMKEETSNGTVNVRIKFEPAPAAAPAATATAAVASPAPVAIAPPIIVVAPTKAAPTTSKKKAKKKKARRPSVARIAVDEAASAIEASDIPIILPPRSDSQTMQSSSSSSSTGDATAAVAAAAPSVSSPAGSDKSSSSNNSINNNAKEPVTMEKIGNRLTSFFKNLTDENSSTNLKAMVTGRTPRAATANSTPNASSSSSSSSLRTFSFGGSASETNNNSALATPSVPSSVFANASGDHASRNGGETMVSVAEDDGGANNADAGLPPHPRQRRRRLSAFLAKTFNLAKPPQSSGGTFEHQQNQQQRQQQESHQLHHPFVLSQDGDTESDDNDVWERAELEALALTMPGAHPASKAYDVRVAAASRNKQADDDADADADADPDAGADDDAVTADAECAQGQGDGDDKQEIAAKEGEIQGAADDKNDNDSANKVASSTVAPSVKPSSFDPCVVHPGAVQWTRTPRETISLRAKARSARRAARRVAQAMAVQARERGIEQERRQLEASLQKLSQQHSDAMQSMEHRHSEAMQVAKTKHEEAMKREVDAARAEVKRAEQAAQEASAQAEQAAREAKDRAKEDEEAYEEALASHRGQWEKEAAEKAKGLEQLRAAQRREMADMEDKLTAAERQGNQERADAEEAKTQLEKRLKKARKQAKAYKNEAEAVKVELKKGLEAAARADALEIDMARVRKEAEASKKEAKEAEDRRDVAENKVERLEMALSKQTDETTAVAAELKSANAQYGFLRERMSRLEEKHVAKMQHMHILESAAQKQTTGFEQRIKTTFSLSDEEALLNVHPSEDGMVYMFPTFMCMDCYPTRRSGLSKHKRLRLPYKAVQTLEKQNSLLNDRDTVAVVLRGKKGTVVMAGFADRKAFINDVIALASAQRVVINVT